MNYDQLSYYIKEVAEQVRHSEFKDGVTMYVEIVKKEGHSIVVVSEEFRDRDKAIEFIRENQFDME